MHFTTLYILKGETLDNVTQYSIEDDFQDRFCYCCGETRPRYRDWCDWFQIGGRWCNILKAKRGIKGERSWCNKEEEDVKDMYSIVEIKDLTEPINREQIYAVATETDIYQDEDSWGGDCVDKEKYNELLDKIDRKEITGVIALIDCHD